jgi:hypothetical protein
MFNQMREEKHENFIIGSCNRKTEAMNATSLTWFYPCITQMQVAWWYNKGNLSEFTVNTLCKAINMLFAVYGKERDLRGTRLCQLSE